MPWNSASLPVRTRYALALCGTLALSACSATYVEVPARLDLAPYGRIAVVTFEADHADSALGALATRRFAEALLASQPGVELLELSPADSALRALTAERDGVALAQAIGRERDVPAVFLGRLEVSDVKPSGRIGALGGVNLRASVSADLTVRLLSTRTGGTVWRSSGAADGTVGHIGLAGGLPSVAVREPGEAYDELIAELVDHVTRDLRPTWVKQ